MSATTFLLVRHAAHDNVGAFLAGRGCDVELGAAGLAQAERLGERLTREDFALIQCSPRRRTRQTAEAIGTPKAMWPETVDELDEIDFGDAWCGRTFEELDVDIAWRRWNAARGVAATPAGDTMRDVQSRALKVVEMDRARFGGRAVVLVSHADVIKSLVLFYLGLGLDAWPRFDIEPASISAITVDDWGGRVLQLNEVVW